MNGVTDLEPVERLSAAQVGRLTELYRDEWWTGGRGRADVERMLGNSDLVLALQEAGSGDLAAFARVLTDGVYKAIIFDVIVAPAYRGLGAGRRLMDLLLAHPRVRDVRHKELYCLPDLVPFYRRWGFSDDVGNISLMRCDRGRSPGS